MNHELTSKRNKTHTLSAFSTHIKKWRKIKIIPFFCPMLCITIAASKKVACSISSANKSSCFTRECTKF